MAEKNEKKLSAKQQEILDYIKEETIKKGYPPTVRDICEAVNLKSTSSVHAHLSTLERNGLIRRDPTKPRAIEIIDEGFQMVRQEMTSIPIVGQVAAGQPILAEENINGYFPLPVEYVPNAETFVLKVKGDSMINAGIHSGDSIFVQSCNSAHNGDIVVALIEDEATVKRFSNRGGHPWLMPENPAYEPIDGEGDVGGMQLRREVRGSIVAVEADIQLADGQFDALDLLDLPR